MDKLPALFRLILIFFFLVLQPAYSQEDTSAPNVVSFDFTPKAVNTDASSQEITFTARLTDDLSGVSDNTQATFESPSGNQEATAFGFKLVSGNALDGIYQYVLTLPKYSEKGIWKLQFFLVSDKVGNRKQLSKSDMIALGFPTEFNVGSEGDTSAPNVVSFDFTPKAVNTDASSQEITFTARLTDDLSGVSDNTQATFESPSGNQEATAFGFKLVSGNALDGIYQYVLTLPKYSEKGIWKLQFFLVSDKVGNRKHLSKSGMIALGFPTEFNVGSEGDTSAPNVVSFDFTPKAVNTDASSQEITFTARLTDDLSGVSDNTQATFESPSGNQEAIAFGFKLVSGNTLDGIYQYVLTLPKYSEKGIWKLQFFLVSDKVGNRKQLSKSDMIALGLPTEFRNSPISGGLSISGMKFNDLDNNGVKDAGESGVPDWTIELLQDSNTIETTATGNDGSYSFNYLGAGTYTVREVPQAGWAQTYPTGNVHTVALSDKISAGNDFGNHQLVNSDTTPPNLVSFDFDPKTINTATSSQQISFTIHVTDDLSGVWHGGLFGGGTPCQTQFVSPSGNQQATVTFDSRSNLISGNELDGVYSNKMTLPRYSEQGTWKLNSILLVDDVNNQKGLSRADAIALGFPTEFQVGSAGDTTPPNILSFDFGPRAINTATSSQEITFTVHLTDDLSGIWHGGLFGGGTPCQAHFVSPSGNQQATVTFKSPSNLISGNELDGVYSNKMTLPRYSEQGTWKLNSILLVDDVNNQKGLSRAGAIALGFPTEFQVGSAGDTTPPNILSFDFGPKAINTATSSQEITFTVHLTDDLSGVWGNMGHGGTPSQAQFKSPSGNQYSSVSFAYSEDLVSGNDFDGIYSGKMTLPEYSEDGTWKLEYLLLVDNVNNQKRLSRADAIALGFPTEFRNSPISGGLSISGMKFNDLNSNGIKDAGESGVPDWTIELLQGGNTIETTATGNDGSYSFNYLGAGTYTVREVPLAGWAQTYPTGNMHTVALSDKISAGNDFGNHQLVNSDINPPNLIGFDFDPKTINTETSSQQISFTAHITDDLSGLGCTEINGVFWCGRGQASFRSPSGQQNAWVSFSSQDLVSGNDLDGVYASKLTLPRYSEQGTWTLESFSIQDRVGNDKRLSRGEMAVLGFPTDFQVESQGDTSPPNLIGFDFDPKTINTATSSQQISFTAHITDDLSGLGCTEINGVFWCGRGQASFRSPSRQQNAWVSFSSQDLVSGNDLDSVYASKLTLPKYSEQGTWTLESFSIKDSVGNDKRLSRGEMAVLGFPTDFQVESQGDTSPPNLIGFDFDPKTINTATSSQQISFTAHITDDLSGLGCTEINGVFWCGRGQASFRSPSRQQNAWVSFSSQDLVSGNDLDGVYASKLTLPKYSEQGTWTLESFSIKDSVGNDKRLSRGEMAVLGFPTEFINGKETEPIAPKASLTKSASSNVVSPGGTLTYTITYANLADTPLQEVVITESYPSGATFLSASPAPDSGTDNRWTIGTLPGHASGTITIDVKAPEETKIKFDMDQSAKGVGFVNTYRNLNTGREPQTFTNQVSMTAHGLTGVTAVSKVTISGEEGTKLALRESGSGTYAREEQLQYLHENRSIKDVSNLSVSYLAANFQLPGNRSIGYNSKWTEMEKAKNYITSESVEESYRYASKINRDSLIALDRNGTRMAVDSQFEGTRHAGYLEASKPDAKGHITPLKELSSDYTGSFRVKEKLGTTFSNRSNAITTVKHYDQPHVTIYQRSEPDNTNENNLNYTISILNDGNRSLGPIYLMDVFPAGTRFFDASTRPSEELLPESEHANWTFTYLPMGQAVTVYLRLMRYVVLEVPVNRVYVNAGYDGNWIKINDSTVSNFNWLSSMPQGERQNTNPGGWNPPDWGFDQTEDICESCTYSPPPD